MKRCPKCNDMAIYDDSVTVCPICDATLAPLSTGGGPHRPVDSVPREEPIRNRRIVSPSPRENPFDLYDEQEPFTSVEENWEQQTPPRGRQVVRPIDDQTDRGGEERPPQWDTGRASRHADRTGNRWTGRARTTRQEPPGTVPQFETRNGRSVIFRGSVAEVTSHSRYYNRFHKIINAVFRGEPYQFGHSSYETVIRVEEFTDGRLPSRWQDLVMYGDIEGSVQVGDDIEARAILRGGRYIIQDLHSNQTGNNIVPGPQMSVFACFLLALLAIGVVVGIIYGVYAFFTKGGFEALVMALVNVILAILGKLLVAIAPLLVVLFIISMFTGIRKR